jgi:hypothetical protein
MIKRPVRLMRMAMMVSVLSLLLTGCRSGPVISAANLIKEHPWLAVLGIAFIKGLLERFGYNVPDILAAAALALAGD